MVRFTKNPLLDGQIIILFLYWGQTTKIFLQDAFDKSLMLSIQLLKVPFSIYNQIMEFQFQHINVKSGKHKHSDEQEQCWNGCRPRRVEWGLTLFFLMLW